MLGCLAALGEGGRTEGSGVGLAVVPGEVTDSEVAGAIGGRADTTVTAERHVAVAGHVTGNNVNIPHGETSTTISSY